MRIVFAGTPEAAVPALRALADSDHEVALVVTRPDAPLGRKRVLTPSPVAAVAVELGLPTLKTARLDDAATGEILATGADLGVIVAYGGLVREPLLTGLGTGWINLHFSLLPAWRGAAPAQRALIAGAPLGWTVFQLVAGLDEGDVYEQHPFLPMPNDTADIALSELARIGGGRMPEIVSRIEAGEQPTPQTGEASYAAKLTFADGALDPTLSADELFNRYRGVTSEPGAYVHVGEEVLKLREVLRPEDAEPLPAGHIAMVGKRVLLGTATTPLDLVRVQPAGKPAMVAGDWWRGLRVDDLEVTA
ncbi:methionyl-tRNA formyltransferase [Microbacterium gorillae]|uniref:methionyl-tRNA formyltransferase n=1 Tax=Microbacterium gorillae TaxID=1231063 RepID=UPI00058FDBF8|nr:methionyl-tRNA formyltransferase [Microbacterium gorillae]